MIEHRWLRIWLSAFTIILFFIPSGFAPPNRGYDATFGVALLPSSIVLKVGQKANISVTITHPEMVDGTQVCYALNGFPSSGFITSFNPSCSDSRPGYSTILMVEVTPAAAPQVVEGYVVASSVGQTAQAVLNLTVEAAMPAWIPWLGLLLFFSLLGAVILWRPKLPGSPRKGSNKRKKLDSFLSDKTPLNGRVEIKKTRRPLFSLTPGNQGKNYSQDHTCVAARGCCL